MEKRSVLERPRNLEGDIYDLMDKKSESFDKEFYKYVRDNFGSVSEFLTSDLWNSYVTFYRNKYEN